MCPQRLFGIVKLAGLELRKSFLKEGEDARVKAING